MCTTDRMTCGAIVVINASSNTVVLSLEVAGSSEGWCGVVSVACCERMMVVPKACLALSRRYLTPVLSARCNLVFLGTPSI